MTQDSFKDSTDTDPEAALSRIRQQDAGGAGLCSDTPLFNIDSQGQWFYQQSVLPEKFAKLFCSILHGVGDEFFLITPVEKVKVSVADEALLIVEYTEQKSGEVTLRSSIGTTHNIADLETFTVTDDRVYCTLERGITAKLNRASFYRFAEQYLLRRD